MRQPPPRSGLTVTLVSALGAAGRSRMNVQRASNTDWRVPPDMPSDSAESPASFGTDGLKVWSP